MSRPETRAEIAQFRRTQQAADLDENVVSTACPACLVRFTMVARFTLAGWHLRCTRCGHQVKGELKT